MELANTNSMQAPAAPVLHNRAAFDAALEDYHPSEEARQVLRETTLVLLVGPTSSGRNKIIDKLLESGRYHYIVSDTTRPPRVNKGVPEQNGVEYWFRSEEDVLTGIRQGEYLEAEIIHQQQVSGISIREMRKAREEQLIAITDVDIGGITNIAREKPDAITLLLLPPDFDTWMERLKRRSTMTKEDERRRLETACRIYATGADPDNRFTILVNDDFEHAVEKLRSIVEDGVINNHEQEEGKYLAERFLAETQEYLKKL
ncbi:MAG TPA: hypothetical protein VLE99_03050 [Candidatus Saccharimonadales bacterium]|nr:hypothetical protein [Candidatus Saccharimonadales bacterium]